MWKYFGSRHWVDCLGGENTLPQGLGSVQAFLDSVRIGSIPHSSSNGSNSIPLGKHRFRSVRADLPLPLTIAFCRALHFVKYIIRYLGTGMRIRHFFSWIRIRLSWKKNQDPTLNRNEEKIYLYFRLVGIKVDLLNHHFIF